MNTPPLTPRKRYYSSNPLQGSVRSAPLVRHDVSQGLNTRPSTSTDNFRKSARIRTAPNSRTRVGTTTRTRTRTGTATTEVNDEFIIALIDNNVKEIGLCIYNLHSFDVELRQYADFGNFSRTLAILNMFDPIEILLSNSAVMGLLDQAIQSSYATKRIKRTYIGRNYYSETNGALAIEKYATNRCPNLQSLSESACYLTLASCAALLRYVEHVYQIFLMPSTLRIRLQPNEYSIFLDLSTLDGLELVNHGRRGITKPGDQSTTSVLSVLDKTITRSGKRFLRRALLEPLAGIDNIQRRQDAVQELTNSEQLYFAIRAVLKTFPDVERCLAGLMTREHTRLYALARLRAASVSENTVVTSPNPRSARETNPDWDQGVASEDDRLRDDDSEVGAKPQQPHESPLQSGPPLTRRPPSIELIQYVLYIKAALHAVAPLLQALENSRSALLKRIAELLRDGHLSGIARKIGDIIEEDIVPHKELQEMRLRSALAIKKGRNGQLDVGRKLLMEFKQEMDEVTDEVRENTGFSKTKLCLQAKRGYHLSLPRTTVKQANLPESFILVDQDTRLFRFTVERLESFNRRFHDTLQNIWIYTDKELGSLLGEIMQPANLSVLHQLCESIAILDCLISFVTYASTCASQMTRPRISLNGPIVLKEAHHPILAYMDAESSVPNEIFLDETSATHIITGRNQSGKSTFIRMVAVQAILAHTGCMVPAQLAYIRVLHRITTKLNSHGDMMQGESHFSTEMRSVATIIHAIKGLGSRTNSRFSSAQSLTDSRPNTLVVIDEVGRATSTEDGFAFAFAIAEHLAKIPNVLTLFTTHFHGLCALSEAIPVISVFHMKAMVQPETDNCNDVRNPSQTRARIGSQGSDDVNVNVKFTYRVEGGEMADKGYGVETVRMAGFPKDVVKAAQEFRQRVPQKSIQTAENVKRHLFRFTQNETEQLRQAQSIVRVAQRKSVIEASTRSEQVKQRKLYDLKMKILTKTRGADADDTADNGDEQRDNPENENDVDDHQEPGASDSNPGARKE